MNKRTKEEEELFVEEEENWTEGDKRGVDLGATVIDREKASVEEARFSDEEKGWVEGEDPKMPDLGEMVMEQLEEILRDLPETSKTTEAVGQGASWMEISRIAEEEGFHRVSNLLFEAEQQGLDEE